MAFLAAAAPIISAIGSAFGVVSAIGQARSAKQASDYNAEIARQNADIARRNAAANASQQQRAATQRLGMIRANQGKSGGSASEGSVLDVLGDVAAQNELERQNILYQGELGARGYSNTASLDTARGRNAATSGYMKAGSDLLTGGYNYYRDTNRVIGGGYDTDGRDY